jgi:hypothetical protein
VLEVGVDAPRIESRSGDSVAFIDTSGNVLGVYSQLLVLDADGKTVPSRMSVAGEAVLLEVDDDRARYPLVVDPIVATEEAVLLAPGQFGKSVSISADGTRALVGMPFDDTDVGVASGTARVLLRAGSPWIEEAVLTVPAGQSSYSEFGWSVSLSGDGTRAVVGDPTRFPLAAWVFVRSGTTWSQEASLSPSGFVGNDFGSSVSLNEDGTRALVATPDLGGARVFVRLETTWSQEALLQFSPAESASLSGDGSRALVGGEDEARVFVRSGSTWTLEANLPRMGFAGFGDSVSLSADGSRALVGLPLVDTIATDAGSARVFVRAGAVWTHEADLFAPGAAAGARFGSSVILDASGSRAIVGAPFDTTLAGTAAGSAHVFVRSGSTWTNEAALTATVGATNDVFGNSVSLTADGGRALIGAPSSSRNGHGRAQALVRTGATWTEEATLFAPASEDFLGHSVSLSASSVAIVGSPRHDTSGGIDAGSARIFSSGGWNTTLYASGASDGDHFGSAVAFNENARVALVGACLDDTPGGVDTGSVRVFVQPPVSNDWIERATLLAPDGAAGDRFGCSVALDASGEVALVGAPGDDTPAGVDAGSVRVFALSEGVWTQEATLLASDGAAGDQFGYSVDLDSSDHAAIVGANRDDTPGGADAGSARIFRRSGTTWTEEVTLLAEDGAANDHFGQSVALRSATALVGADEDDTLDGVDAGSVHVFSRAGTAWTKQATLRAAGGAASDHFGWSVSLSVDGTRAAVGAYADDTPSGVDAGSVRVFGRISAGWVEGLTLLGSGSRAADQVGYAVSLAGDGSRVLVGAPGTDDTASGINAGSARVHTIAWVPSGAVVLVSPSGTTGTSTPTYVWQPEPSSTHYQLWVYDGNGRTRVNQTYEAGSVCAAGGNCSVTPSTALPAGNAQWFLRGIDAAGEGQWSSLGFVVAPPPKPGPVTQTSPSGTIATNNPTYTWSVEPNSTQYQLWVYDSNLHTRVNQTYDAAGVCSGGMCSVTPGVVLPAGNSSWYLRGINAQGPGPWNNLAFVVPGPPGAVTPVSPTGAIATNNPTYVWKELAGATGYHLWVYDRNNHTRVNQMYTTAVCSGGTCSVTPGVALPTGAAKWYIRAQNALEFGPWTFTNFTVP